MATAPAFSAPAGSHRKIKVLIVDDSLIVRRMMERWLNDQPDLDIVGYAINGQEGVAKTKSLQPDVVVLDIEMPILDGLSALPQILQAHRPVRVVMASTLTTRNGEATLKALSLGASDFIPKPEANALAAASDYRREIVEKVRALGQTAIRRESAASPWSSARSSQTAARANTLAPTTRVGLRPDALFVGASTGGPQALRDVFFQLRGKVKVPVFVVQHMPATFTKVLANNIDQFWDAGCQEANDGEPAKPGRIYIAPGGKHMLVRKERGALVTSLNQNPPVKYCRPAVDPLFTSAAKACGDRALCVVLTGMGSDGADGARDVVDAKGAVLIQDEASSVVWGMPGAVAQEGLAAHVSPLDKIGSAISNVLNGLKP